MTKRILSPNDHDLWRRVTRTVTPYRALPTIDSAVTAPSRTGVASPSPSVVGVADKSAARSKSLTSHAPPPHAFASGDPKLDRRAARGRTPIGAVLDLHGMNQEMAHGALARFVAASRLQGCRCVLVITGKGEASSGRGILRARFQDWVNEPGLRAQITRASPAHQRHGGGGAFYVFLKAPEKRQAFSR